MRDWTFRSSLKARDSAALRVAQFIHSLADRVVPDSVNNPAIYEEPAKGGRFKAISETFRTLSNISKTIPLNAVVICIFRCKSSHSGGALL